MTRCTALLDDYGLALGDATLFKLQYYLIRNFIGWSRIDPLMKDTHLEDISCDGSRIPIFLYHRKYRNIRTNIAFESRSPQLACDNACPAFRKTHLNRLADAGRHPS